MPPETTDPGDDPLEHRAVWTDVDFEVMGWHDATVHALAFHDSRELQFDLDYIVRWVDPAGPGEPFTFHVAPATLVFFNVDSLSGDLRSTGARLEILDIEREEFEDPDYPEDKRPRWVIEGAGFDLEFRASGFSQHFRARPIYTESRQELTEAERGPLSFARPTSF